MLSVSQTQEREGQTRKRWICQIQMQYVQGHILKFVKAVESPVPVYKVEIIVILFPKKQNRYLKIIMQNNNTCTLYIYIYRGCCSYFWQPKRGTKNPYIQVIYDHHSMQLLSMSWKGCISGWQKGDRQHTDRHTLQLTD